MEEWEALWASERAAIVARIKENGWGLQADGKTITGPEGFTIDLTRCAAGWSNTEGITDTEFKVGQSIAQSGTLADYGNYAKAIDALVGHYGDEGMFVDSEGKTRTMNYVVKDDGYDPARTIPIVDELLDAEKSFAIWTLGTGPTMKTYDKLNQRCVPNLIAMTGHPAWGDPVNHPWTSGAPVPSYTTETQLWGTFIEQRAADYPDKIKVASLVMNNDFGKVYDAGFKAYLAQSDVLRDKVEYITETIEPQAPTITDPMTTLASKEPDFFIAMVAGTPCTQAVTEAAQNGMKENVEYLFQPLTCAGTSFVSKDDPQSSSSLGNGFGYAFPFVQSLLIAQELD
ncbi:ABC transporter substrate-binding protein, partial [Nocardioides sp.]|uniref:ABC transporter substrate-binding protein n=1 Tax=Nocardioides sp. TaxID=35761 RepID=UPI003D10579A